jgi:hypothetical protein
VSIRSLLTITIAAHDVAEKKAEQIRHATCVKQFPQAVPIGHMAYFVRQHARDLIDIIGPVQKLFEEIDAPSRKSDSVRDL